MGRRGGLLAMIVCVAAAGAAPAAAAKIVFHPRSSGRLGLIPAFSRDGRTHADVATGALTPVVYHAGPVMGGGVTVHTIFWAPPGYSFQGSPGGGVPGYEQLVQQFFTDVAHDSGAPGTCTASECSVFTVLPQFAQGVTPASVTPGANQLSYSAGADSLDSADPYPAKADQCASPSGTATCITDGQVTAEIDHVIQTTPGAGRGLGNLWYVFLPPGVDECIAPKECGTNAFAAYHASTNPGGHGVTVYALSVDPIIETQVAPGADPQGFPDAEAALDGAAHETVEAMTDPLGTGWMDPNGFEVGDKCESGPQVGTPLGFAADGSPYNQVINGHQYLLQQMWANLDSGGNPGCVQATATTRNQLPLPQVRLSQFNPTVTGNVSTSPGGGIGVRVSLVRMGPTGTPVVVARAATATASDGSWSVSLGPHAPGDDRDEIDVDYSGAGAPQPSHQVVLTGNGGNPVLAAGWTGWSFLDAGSQAAVTGGASTLSVAPCSQTGVLSFTFNGVPGAQSPTDFCNLQTDTGTVSTGSIGAKDTLTVSSNDNRAFAPPGTPAPNLLGGLVSLTVPVGEPGSVPQFQNPLAPVFSPTGVPSCTADLELQGVVCVGLVANATYQLADGRQRVSGGADSTGVLIAPLTVHRGDAIGLSNGARTLTILHVARLRVGILGEQATLNHGSCQPGDYYGAPPSAITPGTSAGSPTSIATGGLALTGQVCPQNGNATGLSASVISQTDDLSGGETDTEVPHVLDTSPIDGETVYGAFRALAESGLALPDNTIVPTDLFTRISLRIVTAQRGITVFKAGNVDTLSGVAVPALKPGNYIAIWTLTDTNGDQRAVGTRIIERVGRPGPAPKSTITCKRAGGRISCTVNFPANRKIHGSLKIRLARGGSVVAMGHGPVARGRARIGLRVLRTVNGGAWRAALVLAQPHLQPLTFQKPLPRVG